MNNYHGIKLDLERDSNFSVLGMDLVSKFYSDGKDGIQKAIAKTANNFSYGDQELAQFIYDAASQHHFFYSSPVFSNSQEGYWDSSVDYNSKDFWHPDNGAARRAAWIGEKPKAMPIACFLTFLGDSIESQKRAATEISTLSVAGGGTSLHNHIRAITDKAPGPIPYCKVIDGVIGYYRQGRTRRGSCGIYMDVDHPDVVEFIKIRKPAQGDMARKIDNRQGVHHGINITDGFREAVDADADWELKCPHTGEVREVLKARFLWELMLQTREETGEPYMYFIDVANQWLPAEQKALGLRSNGSNLCSEITLATSEDRTAVCALSSPNAEFFPEWSKTGLIAKLLRFMDNVLQWFIDWAPAGLERAVFSAMRERAIGLGMMGWHNFLMRHDIPYESGGFNSAAQWNHKIAKHCYEEGLAENYRLGALRGEAPDMVGSGKRFSHMFASAPNANSSDLCNTSAAWEPIASNAFPQKTRSGIYLKKNKYLERKLEALGKNNDDVWQIVIDDDGSVKNLDFFTDHDKKVFRTAWEIDQMWTIEHAEGRQPYICQAQSLNVYFKPGTNRKVINQVHLKAMRGRKIKSLYYFRTGAESSADTVKKVDRVGHVDFTEAAPVVDIAPSNEPTCLSCEG